MVRLVALFVALTLPYAALAQTASTPAPRASGVKAAPAKPTSPAPHAGTPPTGPAAADARGPCIGVIPHVGDRFSVQKVGLTVFNNEFSEIPIESWGLDDVVVARVRAVAGPRVTVRRLAYSTSAFNPYDHPASRLFRNAENDLKGVVQSITRGGGCERYVAVIKGQSQFGNSNQFVNGIGVINHGALWSSKSWLFAISGLFVFDGHTFDVIKKGAGSSGESPLSSLLGTNPLHLAPTRELKDFPWPPPPDRLASLREPTRSLLAESLDRALPELLRR